MAAGPAVRGRGAATWKDRPKIKKISNPPWQPDDSPGSYSTRSTPPAPKTSFLLQNFVCRVPAGFNSTSNDIISHILHILHTWRQPHTRTSRDRPKQSTAHFAQIPGNRVSITERTIVAIAALQKIGFDFCLVRTALPWPLYTCCGRRDPKSPSEAQNR